MGKAERKKSASRQKTKNYGRKMAGLLEERQKARHSVKKKAKKKR
jgi:hypothetical protein